MNNEQLNGWKAQEFTREVFKMFHEDIDNCLARLASGEVIGETTDVTAMEVCRLTGMVNGLSKIFNLESEEDE